jgi:hypothetical protein
MNLLPKMLSAFWIAVALAFAFTVTGGCNARHSAPVTPSVTVSPGGGVVIVGDTPTPGTVETSGRSFSLGIPAGSTVTVTGSTETAPGRVSVTMAGPSELRGSENALKATGSTAFAPPAAPSQRELALGWGLKGAFVVGGVLALLGLLLAWRGHGKAAGLAFLGAVGTPASANFIGSTAGLVVSAIATTAAAALFAAWHIMEWRRKKAADSEAAAKLGRQAELPLTV